MGGVMSVNEGPNGETHEYFSTCGPVLQGSFPEPSKYTVIEETNVCVAAGRLEFGPPWEQKIAIGLVWFTLISSIALWFYYTWATFKATCGWEEFYVVNMETLKVLIELRLEYESPAMIYQVILIHLSNLTGLKGEYSRRTMFLLVSDLGTIVWGVSAANATGAAKAIFFCVGLIYGSNTFYNAARVYIEAFHTVPKGICRNLVMLLAWMFFVSWGMFPLGFVAGPEGSKTISYAGSTIVHTFADLLSKNLWGFVANYLRLCIHKHIIMYGDLRKKVKVQIAGEEMELEQYQDEQDEETIKYSTEPLASRNSFIHMRNQMQAQGIETRASLDMSGMGGNFNAMPAMGGVKMMPPQVRAGRVIIGVAEQGHADVFRSAYAQLSTQVEVVPAMGPENVWSTCQQAANSGGFDFVFLHPEYLRDRSGGSLLVALRNNGISVAAYGYEPGFAHELIESSGITVFMPGPTPQGLDLSMLGNLTAQMQAQAGMMAASGGIQVWPGPAQPFPPIAQDWACHDLVTVSRLQSVDWSRMCICPAVLLVPCLWSRSSRDVAWMGVGNGRSTNRGEPPGQPWPYG